MIGNLINKSALKLRQNKIQDAETDLNSLHFTHTQNIDILINLSTISFKKNNIHTSISYLQKAAQIEPFDYRIYYNLFVIYFKQQLLSFSLVNLKKCLSIIYTLMSQNVEKIVNFAQLDRAIQLWDQNTPAFALKAIALIKANNLTHANEVVQEGIQKCTVKHHLYAICCIIDKKLSRQIQRQKNASDYYSSLLKPVHIVHHRQAIILQKQESLRSIKVLVQQFNAIKQVYERGKFTKFKQSEQILFIEMKKPSSINIQEQISSNLGVCDLACIQQEKEIQANQQNGLNYDNKDCNQDQKQEKGLIVETNWGLQFKNQVFDEGENLKTQLVERQQGLLTEVKVEASSPENVNRQQSIDLNNYQNKQDFSTMKKNENQQSSMKKKNVGRKKLYPNSMYTKFRVRLISATIQINQQLLGKMEPYVAYEYGSQKQKTTIAKKQSAAKITSWENEIKVFILDKKPNKLKISIYDRQMFKWDELIGECMVEVSQTGTNIVPLVLNGKKKGSITVEISAQR